MGLSNRPRVIAALVALPCWLALALPALAQTRPATPNDLQRELQRQRRLQSQGVSETALVAIVYNAHGEIVPNISVALHHHGDPCTDDTIVAAMTSTPAGVVVFRNITPGRYRVCASGRHEDSGYSAEPTDIHLARSTITGMEIRVSPTIEERVDVPALPTPLHATSTIEAIFSHDEIENLPLSSGRTLQSLITLMPGITVTESTGTLAQFTAVGQRRFANRLTIDGISADLAIPIGRLDGYGVGIAGSGALPAYGTSGSTQTLVPLDAIQEFQIRTTNAPSEYARTPGAQTTIVTRAGGDRHSGSGFVDTRPRGLAARDWFDNAEGASVRRPDYWNSGMTLGGPLKSPRFRYFGAWEHQYIQRARMATVTVPSLWLREAVPENIRPVLDAFPLPNGPELPDDPGLAEFSTETTMGSKLWVANARLDADLSARDRLFVRFSRGESSGDSLTGGSAQLRVIPRVTSTLTESTATNTATIGLRSGWSSSMHELTVNVTTHDGTLIRGPSTYGHGSDLPFNAFVPSGVSAGDVLVSMSAVTGGAVLQAGGESRKTQSQVQLIDTWSFVRGRHEWRLGLEYRRATPATDPPSHQYTYNFGRAEDLLKGAPLFVPLIRVLPTQALVETWAAFLQDRLRVSRRLSLDFGLRYSVKPAPASLTETEPLLIQFETLPDIRELPRGTQLWNTRWTDFAPRVAAGYQLSTARGRETNVSVGWSLVFDELTSPGAVAFGNGYPFVSGSVVPSAQFPLSPDSLVAPPLVPFRDTFVADAYAFPRNLRSPRIHEWRVAVDQAIGPSQRLGVSYVGSAGRDLVYWHAYDVRGLSGTNGFQRIHAYSNEATSDYHALLVEYVRRAARGLQGRLNYTWSHAIDTDSGEKLIPHAPPTLFSPLSSRASADFDRRHILRVAGSYTSRVPRLPMRFDALLAGWQIDLIGIVQSGTAFTVSTEQFFNLGTYFGAYTVRPDIVPDVAVWIPDSASPTGKRVNPDAFRVFREPRQGSLGRNTLRASTLRQIDLTLSRSIRLKAPLVAHLRLSVFNVLNSSNFGPPDSTLGFDQFGYPFQSYAEAQGTGSLSLGGLVPVQQLGGPRALQCSLRLVW